LGHTVGAETIYCGRVDHWRPGLAKLYRSRKADHGDSSRARRTIFYANPEDERAYYVWLA